jgi:hypothetical protein
VVIKYKLSSSRELIACVFLLIAHIIAVAILCKCNQSGCQKITWNQLKNMPQTVHTHHFKSVIFNSSKKSQADKYNYNSDMIVQEGKIWGATCFQEPIKVTSSCIFLISVN